MDAVAFTGPQAPRRGLEAASSDRGGAVRLLRERRRSAPTALRSNASRPPETTCTAAALIVWARSAETASDDGRSGSRLGDARRATATADRRRMLLRARRTRSGRPPLATFLSPVPDAPLPSTNQNQNFNRHHPWRLEPSRAAARSSRIGRRRSGSALPRTARSAK